MNNIKLKFFVMVCWVVFGVTACGSDGSSDDVACPEIAVNGLEITLYDSETLEPLSETDCSISHANGHDLQWLTYDEAGQYYYGIYTAGSHELWTWCDEYVSQDFTIEIVDDAAACPQPVLEQVSIYLEAEE